MMNEKDLNNETLTQESTNTMKCENGVCQLDFSETNAKAAMEHIDNQETEKPEGVICENGVCRIDFGSFEDEAAMGHINNQETEKPEGVICENGVCRIDFGSFEDEAAEEVKSEEKPEEKTQEENKDENEESMSMQDLMDKYDKPVRMGQVITGKIIQLDEKEAIVGLMGAGNDGKLPVSEVSFDDEKLTERFKVGDEIQAKIIRRPMESDSFFILSMKEIHREESKKELLGLLDKDETIKAKVKEVVKGGLVALYKGNRIFVPSSLVDIRPVNKLEELVGNVLDLNVIEAEERRGTLRIVGSRRKYMEKALQEKAEKTWSTLEEGQIVKGTVERLTDFGAFINVDGVDGLLHISEIAYGKTPRPSSVLKAGEEIETKVIKVDREGKKLSLSLKQLKEDPWKNLAEKYPNNTIVLGKVVRFTNFGAFIELEAGVDGLVHISQISHDRIEKPSDALKIGEEIKVMILDSDEEAKKVSLSVKAVEE